MSQQIKHSRSNQFTLSACAVAMAVTVMAVAPTWTNTAEPAKKDAKAMSANRWIIRRRMA